MAEYASNDYYMTRPPDALDDNIMFKYPVLGGILVLVYIWFVKIYGPKFMANKPPYKLETPIRLYNAFQVLFNGYIICKICIISPEILRDYLAQHCHYTNGAHNPTYMAMLNMMAITYISKLLDLLDSVFMVLRKKFGQLSFLHVYHHAIVVFYMAVVIHDRDGVFILVPIINSAMHVILYFYYFLSSFKSLKGSLNVWKPWITKIQIIQFVIMLGFMISVWYRGCMMGKRTAPLSYVIIFSFLFLFVKFYIDAYLKKKRN